MNDNKKPKYYELRPVYPDDHIAGMRLVTAAVHHCSLCSGMIDTMGGPGHGSVCVRCAEVILSNGAIGCIIWEDEEERKRNRHDTDHTP